MPVYKYPSLTANDSAPCDYFQNYLKIQLFLKESFKYVSHTLKKPMLEDPLKLLLKGSAVSNRWFGVRPPVKGIFGGS